MKLFVAFAGDEEKARFVVLIEASQTVVALRRRISSDFRAVFPARPPLCFFRMASSDGFFLTDSALLSEVLEDGGAVTCHRADEEAVDRPLPENAGAEDVEDVLTTFRSQVAYVARAACHAALARASVAASAAASAVRGAAGAAGGGGGEGAGGDSGCGPQLGAEAMSVVLSMLMLGGNELAPVRTEALAALQRSLFGEGAAAALPAFVAAGGLFVLLSLLSPSTRMDGSREVLEGASLLLERLAAEHGDALAPVLRDCHPSVLLQKVALDARFGAAVQRRAIAVRKLLDRGAPPPPQPMPRPRSGSLSGPRHGGGGGGGGGESLLRAAGAAAVGGGAASSGRGGYAGGSSSSSLPAMHSAVPRQGSASGSRSAGRTGEAAAGSASSSSSSAALLLRTLLSEHCRSDPELRRRSLEQLDTAVSESPEELRELARSPGFLEVVLSVLRGLAQRSPGPELLAAASPLARLLSRLGPRSALCRRLGELVASSSGAAAQIVESFKAAWPSLLPEHRPPFRQLLEEALGTCGAATEGGLAKASAASTAAALASLLDASSPEELQELALVLVRTTLEAGHSQAAAAPVSPKAINGVLLRLIPKKPLLCLDTLGALALQEDHRAFFGSQTSLLQFLVHCCQQPDGVAAAATAGGAEAATVQRAAARALANLSSHPAARDWVKRSAPARSALASAEDFAVRAYLGMALSADGPGAGGAALLP